MTYLIAFMAVALLVSFIFYSRERSKRVQLQSEHDLIKYEEGFQKRKEEQQQLEAARKEKVEAFEKALRDFHAKFPPSSGPKPKPPVS